MKRRELLAATAAPWLAGLQMPAWSQSTFNFTKAVKFIVPYAPGACQIPLRACLRSALVSALAKGL